MQANNDAQQAKEVRSARTSERGSSLVEAALLAIFVLIPLLIGAIDFGRACYVSIEVANAARAGAQYGSQSQVAMADSTHIATVAENEAPDISLACGGGANPCWVSGYPKSAWGCECSNTSTASGGTVGSTSCTCPSGHVVDFVLVTTKATYTPIFNFRGLFSPITLNSQAKMRYALQ
jgi:Flp pilus assembly protein TadG